MGVSSLGAMSLYNEEISFLEETGLGLGVFPEGRPDALFNKVLTSNEKDLTSFFCNLFCSSIVEDLRIIVIKSLRMRIPSILRDMNFLCAISAEKADVDRAFQIAKVFNDEEYLNLGIGGVFNSFLSTLTPGEKECFSPVCGLPKLKYDSELEKNEQEYSGDYFSKDPKKSKAIKDCRKRCLRPMFFVEQERNKWCQFVSGLKELQNRQRPCEQVIDTYKKIKRFCIDFVKGYETFIKIEAQKWGSIFCAVDKNLKDEMLDVLRCNALMRA